jgi:TetR/AcrR family transcriptional repressor of nem operon
VTLSRVVNDPDLAQALLDAAAEQVRDAAPAPTTEKSNAQHD